MAANSSTKGEINVAVTESAFCLDLFKKARIAPCQNPFCKNKDTDTRIAGDEHPCPGCCNDVSALSVGVESFPENIYDAHDDHKVPDMCTYHEQEVVCFCKKCDKIVCVECLKVKCCKHNDDICTVEQGTRLVNDDIKTLAKSLERNIGMLNDRLKVSDSLYNSTSDALDKYKKVVKAAIANYVAEVKESTSDYLQSVDATFSRVKNKVQDFKVASTKTITDKKTILNHNPTQWSQNVNLQELLLYKQQLQQNICEADDTGEVEEDIPRQLTVQFVPQFVPDEQLISNINKLCEAMTAALSFCSTENSKYPERALVTIDNQRKDTQSFELSEVENNKNGCLALFSTRKRGIFDAIFGRKKGNRVYFPREGGRPEENRGILSRIFGRNEEERAILNKTTCGDEDERGILSRIFGRDEESPRVLSRTFDEDEDKPGILSRMFGRSEDNGPLTGMDVTPEGDIVCVDESVVKTFDKKGRLKSEMKQLGAPFDCVVVSDGSMLVSSLGGMIYKVATNGNVSEWFTGEGGMYGLAASSNNQIIVTSFFPTCVQVLSPDAEVIQTFREDAEGKEMFGWPEYVAVNSKNEILVSDWRKDRPTVYILSVCGEMLYKYEPKQECDKLNGPCAVCTDANDNIYVCDSCNNRIVKLTPSGQLCKVILDASDGISHPRAIALDHQGKLVVGEQDGTVKTFEI